jgi:hypothetical protein
VPTKDELFLFLNKRIFLMTSLGALQTHTSHIIHVCEILMLNVIYHYYEVSGEINTTVLFGMAISISYVM